MAAYSYAYTGEERAIVQGTEGRIHVLADQVQRQVKQSPAAIERGAKGYLLIVRLDILQ